MASNQGNQGNQSKQGHQGKQGDGKQGDGGGTSNRGFASMDEDEQREIASQGGKAAHASGNAHEFTSEEARAAGAKSHGGQGRQETQQEGGQGRQDRSSESSSRPSSGGTRGGTSEQHSQAGRQSHKNDNR